MVCFVAFLRFFFSLTEKNHKELLTPKMTSIYTFTLTFCTNKLRELNACIRTHAHPLSLFSLDSVINKLGYKDLSNIEQHYLKKK